MLFLWVLADQSAQIFIIGRLSVVTLICLMSISLNFVCVCVRSRS